MGWNYLSRACEHIERDGDNIHSTQKNLYNKFDLTLQHDEIFFYGKEKKKESYMVGNPNQWSYK